MRRLFISGMLLWIAIVFLYACEIESGEPKVTKNDSAWNAFQCVEDDLQSVVELFENVLRLDQEIQQGISDNYSRYFVGETISHDPDGWWKVADWRGCRFKMLSLNQKALMAKGAQWVALSKYFTNDSLFIECMDENQWIVEGVTKGNSKWRTEVSFRISLTQKQPISNLDSMVLVLQGNGVSQFSENYPASDAKITFSTPKSLLRRNKMGYQFYPFTQGAIQIQINDLRKKLREQAFVEIEELPLKERMVRVTSRGHTEIH